MRSLKSAGKKTDRRNHSRPREALAALRRRRKFAVKCSAMPQNATDSAGKLSFGKAIFIYALGGILYAMLTLSNPLAALPMEEILRRTVSGEIAPPGAAAPDDRHVPAALEAICQKAMDNRYQSVAELREDIFAFQTGYVPKAENASPLKHAGMFLGRNRLIVLLLLTLILAAALATLAYYYFDAIR